MRALVIGGSGLFGKKSCSTLLQDAEFEKVVSLDVVPPPAGFYKAIEPFADRFTFVPGDIGRLEDVMSAAHDAGVDRIVNWAMILSKAPNPRLNTRVGLVGACNVWEAARLLGIKRVVYASSETVYGEQKDYGDRDVKEDDRLLPFTGSFYALAKCLAEVMAAQYHELYGIESTVLRPAIGYGHGGQDPKFVRWFSEIVSLPAIGRPVKLECTGDWLFSLILSDDVAEFARRALKSVSSPHPAYNLGGPPYCLKDVGAMVKRFIPDASISYGSEPEDCELPWKYSSALAKEDYDFSVMPLEQAVLRHINEARFYADLEPLQP